MTSLYTVVVNQTAEPLDINQLVYVLQQPGGGQETGHYFLAGGIFTSGAVVSNWVGSRSNNSTPTGVTLDTSDASPAGGMSGIAAVTQFNSGGFQVYAGTGLTTGPNNNGRAGGRYTIQY